MKVVLELRRKYPLSKILSYLELPRSTYYYIVSSMSKENKDLNIEKRIKKYLNVTIHAMDIEE